MTKTNKFDIKISRTLLVKIQSYVKKKITEWMCIEKKLKTFIPLIHYIDTNNQYYVYFFSQISLP